MFEDPLIKIPHGWRKAKIKDVCELINGRAFKPTEWSTSGKPIIRIQNLNNPDTQYNYCNFDVDSKYLVENGQLLFAWSGTPDTSFGAHIWRRDLGVLNQHIFKIEIIERLIDKLYLMYFLNNNIKRYVRSAHGTAGLAHITKAKFQESIILIPPLPEQRAIVSKIEQLFSELDNGIANLRLAQEQLKVYRQAVLKKAFEGELTRKWRERQTDLPNARDLLEQIRKEREEVAKASGKKVKAVKSLTEDEIAELPGLPDGWGWIRVEEIATKITDGEHITPTRTERGYHLLSARNIQNGYLDFTNVDYVPVDEYLRIRNRCNPEEGDVLISCSGSIGRICSVPKNSDFVMVRSVALIKLPLILKSNKFLEYQLRSPLLQKQIEKGKKATAQANLFLGPISNLKIVLVPLPEQHAIVEEIETRLSVCDKMAQDIDEALEKAEALRQSILKKAFEGKLLSDRELAEVRMAEDWEPAEVLLERIRAERVGNGKK